MEHASHDDTPREKTAIPGAGASRGSDSELGDVGSENAVHSTELAAGEGWYARAQRFVGGFGVEQRGIERVPTDERSDSDMSHIGSLVKLCLCSLCSFCSFCPTYRFRG